MRLAVGTQASIVSLEKIRMLTMKHSAGCPITTTCVSRSHQRRGRDYCWVESAAPAPSGGPWVLPTTGPCLSPYGPRNGVLHAGIDISPPQGTPIVAPTDLKIISAAGKSDGYGNSVVARATDGTNYMFPIWSYAQHFSRSRSNSIKRYPTRYGRVDR